MTNNNLCACFEFAVFHVKDEHGNKLTDQKVINYIQKVIIYN